MDREFITREELSRYFDRFLTKEEFRKYMGSLEKKLENRLTVVETKIDSRNGCDHGAKEEMSGKMVDLINNHVDSQNESYTNKMMVEIIKYLIGAILAILGLLAGYYVF